MKPLLKKFMVPALSAVVGGLLVATVLKASPQTSSKFISVEMKSQNDPFEQMKTMRQQMQTQIAQLQGRSPVPTNPFDSWFPDKFGARPTSDISRREDDDFVYYDIKIADLNATALDTKVQNGYITVTGTLEKKSNSNEDKTGNGAFSQYVYKSSFNRIFPLPANVDESKMQTMTEKDAIVLKFPKVKS